LKDELVEWLPASAVVEALLLLLVVVVAPFSEPLLGVRKVVYIE